MKRRGLPRRLARLDALAIDRFVANANIVIGYVNQFFDEMPTQVIRLANDGGLALPGLFDLARQCVAAHDAAALAGVPQRRRWRHVGPHASQPGHRADVQESVAKCRRAPDIAAQHRVPERLERVGPQAESAAVLGRKVNVPAAQRGS